MHITKILLDAADRGELPRELLLDILKEHLATFCPVCAEALAAHQTGLSLPAGGSLTKERDPLARLGRRLGLGQRALRAEARVAQRARRACHPLREKEPLSRWPKSDFVDRTPLLGCGSR